MSELYSVTDLFRPFDHLQRQMVSLFGGFPSSVRAGRLDAFPQVNIGTTDDSIEIVAFAPGVSAAGLDVSIGKGLLTISGERKPAQAGSDDKTRDDIRTYAWERFAGAFRRVIVLSRCIATQHFTLLYLGGLRITEVGTNTMGRFFRRADETGTDRWWLDVMGKGGKERLVPATAEMMSELGTYRRARGLPALPSPGEDTPLVLPVGQSLKPLTRAALHRIVKDVFNGAAQSLRTRGEDHAPRADRLDQASAHWLRHSAGSHMADRQVDLRPRACVTDDDQSVSSRRRRPPTPRDRRETPY